MSVNIWMSDFFTQHSNAGYYMFLLELHIPLISALYKRQEMRGMQARGFVVYSF